MTTCLTRSVLQISRNFIGNLALCATNASRVICQSNLTYSSRHIGPVSSVLTQQLHTSPARHGLLEFFDDKREWGEQKAKAGRPWKVEELRLKSNSDLHKLWYVLLKERNMLMTMEEEYNRELELLPSPERFEKVEESMENVLKVVKERDRAYNLLEKGETGEPGGYRDTNILGQKYWRKRRESVIPSFMNKTFMARHDHLGVWMNKLRRREIEQKLRVRTKALRRDRQRKENLKRRYPNADTD
ncbi:unnamed protein product [Owenia fusiformis]|uniref:Large ribosomal subunit protein uL29m n=1 Tax=Owenia fusiformis TaxID=6347 RepID=A0A8S4N6G3_OWEFU|nr:unnamed protein product [Owenia fusiformis]